MAQLRRVCALGPRGILLREKDLTPEEYTALARQVQELCGPAPLFLHTHTEAALLLNIRRIHFSLPALRLQSLTPGFFEEVSVSCHSVEDVLEAEALGATQAILGNIYETECKKGLPGRGLELLSRACAAVHIPVYAIGGVNEARLPELLRSGAAGGCMMSRYMRL